MKKFRYKLDPLLKIRKFQEKMEYAKYASVLGRVNHLQAEILKANENQKHILDKEKKAMVNHEFNLEESLMYQEYKQKLNFLKASANEKIESMRAEFESLRKKAEDARKNRRILEILRDKKQAAFNYAVDKEDQKQMDEFNQRLRKEVSYE